MRILKLIVIVTITLLSLVTNAATVELSTACSHVAELANQGRLVDSYLKYDRQVDDWAQLCVDFDGDGRDECIDGPDSDDVTHDIMWLDSSDGGAREIRRDPNENWTRQDIAPATRRGVVWFEGQYYIVYGATEVPSYLAIIDAQRVFKIHCEFVQRDGMVQVATPYEQLIRSAGYEDVWVTAFMRPGTEAVELLLANGHTAPDTINALPVLSWAIQQKRADAVEWLIQHGSAVNAQHPSDTPLVRAVWVGELAFAVRLLRLGADPLPLLGQLKELQWAADSPDARALIMAAVKRLGHISEAVIRHAITHAPGLLDDLKDSGLPVRYIHREWYAGRQAALPFDVRADVELHGSPAMIKTLERIYKRGAAPPVTDTSMWLSYGSFEHGLLITRHSRSSVSDEDLLRFATSVCIYFGRSDCGPKRLQRSAREWVEQLRYECPKQTKRELSPSACSLLMHHLHPARPPYLSTLVVYEVTQPKPPARSPYLDLNMIQNVYLSPSLH